VALYLQSKVSFCIIFGDNVVNVYYIIHSEVLVLKPQFLDLIESEQSQCEHDYLPGIAPVEI
jgi:hypothetical protein